MPGRAWPTGNPDPSELSPCIVTLLLAREAWYEEYVNMLWLTINADWQVVVIGHLTSLSASVTRGTFRIFMLSRKGRAQ
jgi:hypothetical protein